MREHNRSVVESNTQANTQEECNRITHGTTDDDILAKYNELNQILEARLGALCKFSTEKLGSLCSENDADFKKIHTRHQRYLNTCNIQAENLKNLILTFSKVNKQSEFFSKHILKKYVGHEFLTEGGYPNDHFRIELLTCVIQMIKDPTNNNNQKKFNEICGVLPEGTSEKLPILLGMAAFVLAGVALTGLMIGAGPAAIMPIAIAVTMFTMGFFGSFFALQAIPILQAKHETYKKYKDEITNISKNLRFFTQDEMEKTFKSTEPQESTGIVSTTIPVNS